MELGNEVSSASQKSNVGPFFYSMSGWIVSYVVGFEGRLPVMVTIGIKETRFGHYF